MQFNIYTKIVIAGVGLACVSNCGNEGKSSWRKRFPTAESYKQAIDSQKSMIIYGAELDNAVYKWQDLRPNSSVYSKETDYWLNFQFEIVKATLNKPLKKNLRRHALYAIAGQASLGNTNLLPFLPWLSGEFSKSQSFIDLEERKVVGSIISSETVIRKSLEAK